ncbi:MAG TPA: ABC transporter permease subunit/CPBP intramembrane protease [Phycisphaerae bacterium]|nr:ABC transporter permease subunit/CPBP intramembrane protease [Phycisphaerae bacterium]HOM50101.1 ABC transporter permease subunit/CPBP intramembrane protease [Phycisphaerae bacterium]HPP26596.1 ABC transporter permease subunit/CPBP intramembrane protease [Phycisphaerae bacterium]HPU25060.1 ABC transporter permease subunit/CPBP intramembrane protease [Phycisphaerae bacterium]HPZ97851.1 ABC transporter permease subunit/CPBP intramembrane protease [Phycisphaerae bacterium]
MSRSHRVWVIYRKELLEILRDRRTLTAMVVIPVVLYPLLMLGFLRAAESEEARLRGLEFVVEVPDERAAGDLRAIIDGVRRYQDEQADQQTACNSESPGHAAVPTADWSRARFDIRVRPEDAPDQQLGEEVHLRVRVQSQLSDRNGAGPAQLSVHITFNEVNIKSRTAMEELSHILEDFRDLAVRERVAGIIEAHAISAGVSPIAIDTILEPVRIETVSVATDRQRGGWALGQIIPIILVLMTITGSVYPAIDLTAGERERGTLETLMATPVPPLQLILGKFLVVSTLGMLTAFLNVASVGATMHFSGLTRSITHSMPVEIPLSVLPLILACMVPFSLLFAAILIAVCSFARTFKEAQSYVMPVILGAMIPAVAVTLPTARLGGILLVMPVGNMVLLAREIFQGSFLWSQVAVVLISTSFYAAAAVAVAVRLFGQEAVVFADAGSYKTLLLRRYYRPSPRPTLSQALLLSALLFPASFYVQSVLTGSSDNFIRTLGWLAIAQFAGLFVLLPVALTAYYRIDVVETFRLRLPPARAWLAALLLGCSSWALAHQFVALQTRLAPPSDALREAFKLIESQLAAAPLWQVVLLLAVVPAVCEELFFRGFLLSGLAQGLRKGSAIILAGLVFGIFHFIMDRVPVTALLGICLGYVCWQARSIWPGILFHALHNGLLMVLNAVSPETVKWLGMPDELGGLLPARVLVPALALFAAGLCLAASCNRRAPDSPATLPDHHP